MKPGASSGSSNRKERSFAPTSAPSSSLVKVESIFIDIVAAEVIKAKKCEHFTIRGFVSKSCEQNEKLCAPLFVDAGAVGSEKINSTLYPLHAPHFKSWRCQNCLNDIESALGEKSSHNNSVRCSKQLKAKSFRSQRSLKTVVAYLSEKLKQTSELGRSRALCQGVESNSKFKQKQKRKQKQKLDSALHSNTRGFKEKELHNAAIGFISNKQDSLARVDIDEHQKESLKPPRTTTSLKPIIVDVSPIKGRHGAVTKLVQRQHDDSVGTGCRKSKAKKVRLLNEILEKDGKGSQLTNTKGFHSDEPAKASCSATLSLEKVQFHNERCQVGQKRNNNDQEQDIIWSQMHHANTVDGNCERRKAQALNSAYADELHVTSNNGRINPVIEQADKMFLGRKQRADGHKDYPHRGLKTNNNSCLGQDQLATYQPFHGKDSMPHSQLQGKSNGPIHNVHEGANLLSPSDNGRGLEENNVTMKRMETIQIGQSQCSKPTQHGNSSGQHYSFAEGCLDPRKGTVGWFPGAQNENLRNDTGVYMGESSTACNSLVDKNIRKGTNSISALKRPNPGQCCDNKKQKHRRRTEGGPTDVHQMELLLRNSNMKMRGGMGVNPESTLCEIRGNLRQEVGTSDDIPMEIVELMAKNQYERRLHEVGDNHYEQQSGSNRKKDLMGRTSMLPSGVSEGPLPVKPQLLSPRITSEQNMEISNGKPIGNILQRPTSSTHRPLIQGQRELSGFLQFPAMGSSRADIFHIQNSKYDMCKSASEQRLLSKSQGQFELWQPSSQQSDRTDRPWPMVLPNNPVHKPSVLQGNALQSFTYGEVPKCSSYVAEGRPFSNLALAGKKINNIRPEASHSSHPIRVDSRPHMSGSPDPYANEAILAMNLLSLMNGHPQSTTSINMDAVANRKSFDRSFSNDHLAKELSVNSFAMGKSGYKLKQPSPYSYQSKNSQSDASCQCSPPVPTFSSAAASLHGDVGDKRVVQPLSNHQERIFSNVNPGGSFLPNENRSIIYQQSSLSSTVGVAFQQLIPAHELANHIFSHSCPRPYSTHLFMNGNFNGYRNLEANESFEALDKRAELGVCSLNRNPMEFSTPGPGNEFMIGPEELKLRKTYPPKFTRPVASSSFKQQGFIKYAAPNNRV